MKVDKKVEKVKAALAEFKKDTLTKIITRKKEEHTIFYRQVEFKKWLEENFTHFNKRELKYLGYETKEEITTKSKENSNVTEKKLEEKTQEITKNNTDIILSELLSQDDVKDKFVYFLSNIDEFLGIKKQLEKNLVIPPSLLKNEAIGVTVRLWKSTIEEFNKFCDEHKNYTKLQLMSYALTEFLEKYKNEK